jgi:hypothetical protein
METRSKPSSQFKKNSRPSVVSLWGGVALSLLALNGCGSSGDVKNLLGGVQASANTQNGDLYATVSAKLNTANYSMASFSIPITDARRPGVEYGFVSLRPAATGGGGVLVISVNVSEAAHIPSSAQATLPNGTAFPLAVPTGESVIEIPIGAKGAEIYLLASEKSLMLGTAIPFAALNGVGQYVPGINVFAPVSTPPINSFVGIFAGSGASQTGLGLFIDLSGIMPKPEVPAVTTLAVSSGNSRVAGSSSALRVASSRTASEPLRLNAPNYSSRAEQKLYYKLWETGENNPVLRFQ